MKQTLLKTLGLAAVVALAVSPALGDGAYPRTCKDAKGHAVTLAAPPLRIASLTLGTDENLLDLVAPERLVAMTAISKEPFISNVAGRTPAHVLLVGKSAEPLGALKPDLVLVATYTPELAAPLLAAGLPVYEFTEFHGLESNLRNLELLGQLVGEEAKAAAILADCRARLKRAADKAAARVTAGKKPVRALYFSEGRLAGAGTTPSDVLRAAGLIDVCSEFGLSGSVQATPRLMANLNPEVIFLGEDSAAAEAETRKLFASAPYLEIAAARAGRIYALPGKHVTTISYHVVAAVEDAQSLLGW